MWHGVAGEVLGHVMSSRESTGITVVLSLRVQVLAAAETKNSNTGSGSRGAHSASSSSNTTGRSVSWDKGGSSALLLFTIEFWTDMFDQIVSNMVTTRTVLPS